MTEGVGAADAPAEPRRVVDGRSIAIGVAAVTAVLSALVGVGSAATLMGPDPAVCSGDVVTPFQVDEPAGRIYANTNGSNQLGPWVTFIVYPLAEPVPAGRYDVDAIAWDRAATRNSVEQPMEVFFAALVAADGEVVAVTETSPDLEDGVDEVTWAGSLGTVEWMGADAVDVRVVHGALAPGNPNALTPVCLGLTAHDDTSVSTSTAGVTTTTARVLGDLVERDPAEVTDAAANFTG